MLDNFWIFHRSGQCVFSEHLGRCTPIELSLIRALISSSSSFLKLEKRHNNASISHTVLEGEARMSKPSNHVSLMKITATDATEIVFGELKFVFVSIGSFMLIGQAQQTDNSNAIRRVVGGVHDTILFYLGKFVEVAQDITIVQGVLDFVKSALLRSTELRWLCDGLNMIPLDSLTVDTVDCLMSTLEECDAVQGSLLMMGGSVVHCKTETQNALLIVQHISVRPLFCATVRALPVFVEGNARNLFLVKINSMTLAVITDISTSFSELVPYIEHFESALEEDVYQLPQQEPRMLLRHFTGHDTLVFLFHDDTTNTTVAPELRKGTLDEHTHIIERFRWFFDQTRNVTRVSGISRMLLSGDEYNFHFHWENSVRLYAMFSKRIDTSLIDTLSKEIITNARRVLACTDS